jgi:hypothetical protein
LRCELAEPNWTHILLSDDKSVGASTMLPTLQRVYELPIGQKLIVYVGNFEYDIARCDKQSPTDVGAPKYRQVLSSLQESLRILHDNGTIRVDKIERQHHRTNNKGKTQDWRDFAYEVQRLK